MFIYKKCLLHALSYTYTSHSFLNKEHNLNLSIFNIEIATSMQKWWVSKIDIAHKFITMNYDDWWVSLMKKKRF